VGAGRIRARVSESLSPVRYSGGMHGGSADYAHDWLFDLLAEVCDLAEARGFRDTALAVEAAMDAYLAERERVSWSVADTPVFRSVRAARPPALARWSAELGEAGHGRVTRIVLR
jgi:hypothetical protein